MYVGKKGPNLENVKHRAVSKRSQGILHAVDFGIQLLELTDNRAEISTSPSAQLKLLSQFIRMHGFFSQSSAGQFTTSERRKFERDIYDYARARNLSQKHARQAIAKARDFCEQGCDSDNSAWESEIDDSTEILKKLCVSVSRSSKAESSVSSRSVGDILNEGRALSEDVENRGHETKRSIENSQKQNTLSQEPRPVSKHSPDLEGVGSVDYGFQGRVKPRRKRKQSQLQQCEMPGILMDQLDALPNNIRSMLADPVDQFEGLRVFAKILKTNARERINMNNLSKLDNDANEVVINKKSDSKEDPTAPSSFDAVASSRLTSPNLKSPREGAIEAKPKTTEAALDTDAKNRKRKRNKTKIQVQDTEPGKSAPIILQAQKRYHHKKTRLEHGAIGEVQNNESQQKKTKMNNEGENAFPSSNKDILPPTCWSTMGFIDDKENPNSNSISKTEKVPINPPGFQTPMI